MLKNRNILLGITGSIAAYKTPELIRLLKKQGASVKAILTGHANHFVGKSALAMVSENPVFTDMFEDPAYARAEHISLSEWAHALVIAPSTANIIGKCANGIADDFLSTEYLSMQGPVIMAPAMNSRMYFHAATQENIRRLHDRGVRFVGPGKGALACGESGMGRMSDPVHIVDAIIAGFQPRSLKGRKVLVTAGGTKERVDIARCLTNFSSGKMGHAFARAAYYLGAEVTCISAAEKENLPDDVKTVYVESAEQMFDAVKNNFKESDIVVMAAAVADHRPAEQKSSKIKKQRLKSINLSENPDILEYMGTNKSNQFILGFALETKNGLKAAHGKLIKKKCNLIALNNPALPGSGFGEETNIVTLIDSKKNTRVLPKMDKTKLALKILKTILTMEKSGSLKTRTRSGKKS